MSGALVAERTGSPLPMIRLVFLAFALVSALAGQLAAAKPAVIDLWPEGVPGLLADARPETEDNGRFTNIHYPTLVQYEPTGAPSGTAVIYAPGGGYVRVAAGENGGEITRWLNSLGVTVFLLKYRHAEYGHPAPLRDALRAVRLVRSRAAEFKVQPDRIGMIGGSAGGHLTATAGTLFDAPEGRTGHPLDQVSGRPDFMVLVFPLITMQGPHVLRLARRALLGPEPNAALEARLSPDQQVTKATPPAFIVHTTEDTTAPVENSLLLFQALRRTGVPVEMHLYSQGPHGSGMSAELGPVSEWPRLCARWMRHHGWLPSAEEKAGSRRATPTPAGRPP